MDPKHMASVSPDKNRMKHIQVQLVCDTDSVDDRMDTFAQRYGIKEKKIRDLQSNEVENLVCLTGICVQAKAKQHKARVIHLQCRKCEHRVLRRRAKAYN